MHEEGSDHLSIETSQFDEVVATMRDVFGRIEVRREDSAPVLLRMRSSSTSGLRMTRWSMSGRCSGDLDLLDDDRPTFLAGIALSGDVEIRSTSTVLDTSRPYLCPDRFDWQVTCPDIVNLALDRAVLEASAGALLGSGSFPVRFADTAPLDDLRGRAWRDTVAYAWRVLDLLAAHPEPSVIRSAAVEAVCTVMLQTFPNTALSAAAHGSKRPSIAVRRAVEFIDEHLEQPIRAPELAEAARMSLRGLHAAFRRELDTTPMAYVRAARLAAARQQLKDADPSTVDLTAIALQWGFTSARQFGERYVRIYHEAPADTARD